jgi:hypothetical protein
MAVVTLMTYTNAAHSPLGLHNLCTDYCVLDATSVQKHQIKKFTFIHVLRIIYSRTEILNINCLRT